jgi:hypothetical protein
MTSAEKQAAYRARQKAMYDQLRARLAKAESAALQAEAAAAIPATSGTEEPLPVPHINPAGAKFCGKVIWPRRPTLYGPQVTERDVLAGYNLASYLLDVFTTQSRPDKPRVANLQIRRICRALERASSLHGVLCVMEECGNAFETAGGNKENSRSPGVMEMIDTADKKAERSKVARRRREAKRADPPYRASPIRGEPK